jgi:hypothetical protein
LWVRSRIRIERVQVLQRNFVDVCCFALLGSDSSAARVTRPAKRQGRVNLEPRVVNPIPASGTVAVRSGHQAIKRVIDLAQTCLQNVAAGFSLLFEQRHANVFTFFVQAVPYQTLFSAKGDFN